MAAVDKAKEAYNQYKRQAVQNWAQLISLRAGYKPGSGRRSNEISQANFIHENFLVEYHDWKRYKAGKQSPSWSRLQQIHKRALELKLLGQGKTLRALQERPGIMSESEWEEWQLIEADPYLLPDPEAQTKEAEKKKKLRARLQELEREVRAIRKLLKG